MHRQTEKPGWNLTVWAVAGFVLVALAIYVVGGPPSADLVTPETLSTN